MNGRSFFYILFFQVVRKLAASPDCEILLDFAVNSSNLGKLLWGPENQPPSHVLSNKQWCCLTFSSNGEISEHGSFIFPDFNRKLGEENVPGIRFECNTNAEPYQVATIDLSGADEIEGNNCGLVGTIPSSFRQLANLTELNLTKLNFLTEILGLPDSLTHLYACQSENGPKLVPLLPSLPNLAKIDLKAASISGTFPLLPSRSPQLQEVYLSFNRISGSLPDLSPWAGSLKNLFIDQNNMIGSIKFNAPMLKLEQLGISGNAFSGPLPGNTPILEEVRN